MKRSHDNDKLIIRLGACIGREDELADAVQAIVSKENLDMTQEAHVVVARDTRCIDILE
jgi:hypothetical protein